jgi:cysteine desulfurase / selenocysteine lyase
VIEARVLELAGQVRAMLCGLGASVNHNASQIVTTCLPGHEPSELVRRLREERILVSARHGRLRVSPHFYNDGHDVEKLRGALRLVARWRLATPDKAGA